jgi:hypothetical protein
LWLLRPPQGVCILETIVLSLYLKFLKKIYSNRISTVVLRGEFEMILAIKEGRNLGLLIEKSSTGNISRSQQQFSGSKTSEVAIKTTSNMIISIVIVRGEFEMILAINEG